MPKRKYTIEIRSAEVISDYRSEPKVIIEGELKTDVPDLEAIQFLLRQHVTSFIQQEAEALYPEKKPDRVEITEFPANKNQEVTPNDAIL